MSSAARIVLLLECLAEHDRPLTRAEIASATGLPRTTVVHLLADMRELGFVELVDDRRYAPGPASLALASGVESRRGLQATLRPVLERIARTTGETSALSILRTRTDGRPEAVNVVDWVPGTHPLGLVPSLGVRPLQSRAAGQVFLAFANWPPGEGNDATGDELSRARLRGYATSEVPGDVTAIAAPVFDISGRVAAAISVAGPSGRMRPVERTVWPALKRAIDELSKL